MPLGRGDFLDERIEPVQIDRFDQMMIKAAIVAFSDVLFHSETGQRDAADRALGAELLH